MKDRRDRLVLPQAPLIRAALEQNLPPGMRLSNGAMGIALGALREGVRPAHVARTVAHAGEIFVKSGRNRGKIGPFGPGRTVFEDLKDHTLLTKAQNSW